MQAFFRPAFFRARLHVSLPSHPFWRPQKNKMVTFCLATRSLRVAYKSVTFWNTFPAQERSGVGQRPLDRLPLGISRFRPQNADDGRVGAARMGSQSVGP